MPRLIPPLGHVFWSKVLCWLLPMSMLFMVSSLVWAGLHTQRADFGWWIMAAGYAAWLLALGWRNWRARLEHVRREQFGRDR